jgi:DNA-binding MarR family transcriptional regulator
MRETPTFGHLLWRVALRWRAAMDRALAPLGLTSAQYGVLASLYWLSLDGGLPSQRELAEISGLAPMQVSKLARGLERAGYLRRATNPADPRAVQLTLTSRGRDLVPTAAQTVHEFNDRLLTPLGGAGSTRTAQVMAALQELYDHTGAMSRRSPE